MFDPFFALFSLSAPVVILVFVVLELRRRDTSIRPKPLSIGLAVASIGGLWLWFVIAGVERWGKGMDENGFEKLMTYALLGATGTIIAVYCLVALIRTWWRSER